VVEPTAVPVLAGGVDVAVLADGADVAELAGGVDVAVLVGGVAVEVEPGVEVDAGGDVVGGASASVLLTFVWRSFAIPLRKTERSGSWIDWIVAPALCARLACTKWVSIGPGMIIP